MDGHFGAWSQWTPCTHTDGSAVGTCLCRTRACDSPAPQCGGWQCTGPRMEITNCSRCVAPNTQACFHVWTLTAEEFGKPFLIGIFLPQEKGRKRQETPTTSKQRFLWKEILNSKVDYKSDPVLVSLIRLRKTLLMCTILSASLRETSMSMTVFFWNIRLVVPY